MGGKSGWGPPGHGTKATPEGPSLRKVPKEDLISRQVKRGASEFFHPRDPLRPASKIKRAGPSGNTFPQRLPLRSPRNRLFPPPGPTLIASVPFHMPSQIGSPAEGLPTLGALEGPLTSVESPVADELRDLAEHLPTHAAFVTLFRLGEVLRGAGPGALLTALRGLLPAPGQCLQAHPSVPRGRRPGRAAFRQHHAGVFSLVDAEGVLCEEVLPTLLFRVGALVIHQAVLAIKRFLTQVTLVAPLSTVDPLVIQEASLTCEALPTFLAPESLLLGLEDLGLRM